MAPHPAAGETPAVTNEDGPIERHAAARFLAERYGPGAGSVAELSGGEWSRAFSFRLDGCDLVARFGRHVEDFIRDRKAMAFARPELPIPKVLEIGEAPGGYYAISERHFGVFLETLNEREWRSLMPALLRALDALRATRPPGSGVEWASEDEGGPSSWRQWLVASLEDRPGERVSGWRAGLAATPEVEAVFTSGERALRSLVAACPEVRHVLHLDLLHRNVLVAPDASRLEAVFDWGCSVAGDFLYEVAWFTFWAPWHPTLDALDFRRVIQDHYETIGLKVESFPSRLACYELHIGLAHIAYAAFTGREDDLHAVARRTAAVLDHPRR
jgi:aminoglycoside phosphotransferase (APT) family kinase protein